MFTSNPPAPHDSAVVVLSGGLDSAVALALARLNTCHSLKTITFHYGQVHLRETTPARELSKHYNAQHHMIYESNLNFYDEEDRTIGIRTSLATEKFAKLAKRPPLVPRTWTPGRNIIFLTHAAMYAWWAGSNIVVAGIHSQDQPGYPDCRLDFLQNMEYALQAGLGYTLSLWMPLLNKTKAEIVQLGFDLGVPFEKTWSCYVGEEEPCGKCDACIRRAKAFATVGKKDPLLQGGKK